MSECKLGLWGAKPCRFEPRYDKSPADLSRFQNLNGYGVPEVLETMRAKTYVRDVCVNCGKTIERSKP
jgi:hypothetical protein